MASTNSPVTLQGDFKNLYKDSGLVDALPSWAILQDRFAFEEAEATGQYFVMGVILAREQGFSYAPSSGSSSGPITLNASVAGYVGQAQIEGYSIYLRSRLSYDAAAKASRAGKKAFASAYSAVLKNMKESHAFRLELSLLYGQSGLAAVTSNTSGALLLSDAAAGAFSGQVGAVLEAWTGTGNSATQHNGDLTISNVSIASNVVTVTVTGTNAAVVANDVLYFKGARTASGFNETPGLYKILTNASTIFNIDASVYDLWKSQSYPVSGNLSLTAIMQASAVGMVYGLNKAILLCNPSKFAQLASDEAALRRYVQDTPNAKRGAKGIVFVMGNVEVEIIAHPFVRPSQAMLLEESSIHRIGATDITFGMPGTGEAMEVHVTDTTALELRSMSDNAIYSEMPAACVILTGIT